MYDFNIRFKPSEKTVKILEEMGFKKACAFHSSNDFFVKGVKTKDKQGGKGEFTVLRTTDQKKLLYAAQHGTVDAFTGVEDSKKRDYLNQRYSGLNESIAKFMGENKVSLLISFQKADNHKTLGRMRQNVKLCLKHGAPIIIGSGATRNEGIVHPESLIGLGQLLGMNRGEAKKTVTHYPKKILERNEKRRDPGFIMPGVRVVKRGGEE